MTFFLKPEKQIKPLTAEEKKEQLENLIYKYFDDPYIIWSNNLIDVECLVYDCKLKRIEQEKGVMQYKFTKTEKVTEIFAFKEIDPQNIDAYDLSWNEHKFSKFITKRFLYEDFENLVNQLFIWKREQ